MATSHVPADSNEAGPRKTTDVQLEMVVVTHQGVTVQPYPEPFKLLSNSMNF
jgi:hypothetical protein